MRGQLCCRLRRLNNKICRTPIMEKIESNRSEKLNDLSVRNDSTSFSAQYGTPGRAGAVEIDYKNTTLLFRYLTEQGKIIPRRLSGLTAKQQRYMTKAIKQARILGLIRFTNNK